MHLAKLLGALTSFAIFAEASGYGLWDADGMPLVGAAKGRLVRLKRGGFGTVRVNRNPKLL